MLQYGLFNDENDSDPTKVKGIIDFGQALEMKMPSIMKEYVPYSTAKKLLVLSTTIIFGAFILY
jgi:hypothetical protein